MKVLDVEQRSEAWHELRRGKITGSKAKDYLQPRGLLKQDWVNYAKENGKMVTTRNTVAEIKDMFTEDEALELESKAMLNDHIYKLIAENVAKPINPNDYTDRLNGRPYSAMTRGEILEDEAREAVAKKLGKEVLPGRMWQHDKYEDMLLSPDGEIVNKDGSVTEAVEIKCLDSWKLVKAYYEDQYPQEYKAQVLQYFIVNEKLEKLHFALYSDCFALVPEIGLQIFGITREDVAEELALAERLSANVLNLVHQEVERLTF